jgi:hypothetical protein
MAKQIGPAVEIACMIETQRMAVGRLEELTATPCEQHHLFESLARLQDTFVQLVLTNQGISAIAAALARTLGLKRATEYYLEGLALVRQMGHPAWGAGMRAHVCLLLSNL